MAVMAHDAGSAQLGATLQETAMQATSLPRLQSAINITPLIDIVLVLLIVFIVMLPILGRHHPVVIPATDGSGVSNIPLIALAEGGSCTLQGEPIALDELARRLLASALLQPPEARRVQLKVEGAVPMARVTEILDTIRVAGEEARRQTPGYDAAKDTDYQHKDDIKVAMTMKKG